MSQRSKSNSWPTVSPRGRNGICRRCGEPNELSVGVLVQTPVRAGHETRASTSVTLCEDHALELWSAISGLVEDYRRIR